MNIQIEQIIIGRFFEKRHQICIDFDRCKLFATYVTTVYRIYFPYTLFVIFKNWGKLQKEI